MIKSPIGRKKGKRNDQDVDNLKLLLVAFSVVVVLLLLPALQRAATWRKGGCPKEPYDLSQVNTKLNFYPLEMGLKRQSPSLDMNRLECVKENSSLDCNKVKGVKGATCVKDYCWSDRAECELSSTSISSWDCVFDFPDIYKDNYILEAVKLECDQMAVEGIACTPCKLSYVIKHRPQPCLFFCDFKLNFDFDLDLYGRVMRFVNNYYAVIAILLILFSGTSILPSGQAKYGRKERNRRSRNRSSRKGGFAEFLGNLGINLSSDAKKSNRSRYKRRKSESSTTETSSSDIDTDQELEDFFSSSSSE